MIVGVFHHRIKRQFLPQIGFRFDPPQEKGDPLQLASTMAVVAAKQTPSMVALCHQLKIEKIEPKVKVGGDWVEVTVKVAAHEKTGVEMEALTAVSVALLNVWDVVKAYEKDSKGQYPLTSIESIRVTRKVKRGS